MIDNDFHRMVCREISRHLVIQEAYRSGLHTSIARDIIGDHVNGYYKVHFGHTLSEFKRIELEIKELNEVADMCLRNDMPRLSESLSQKKALLKEGAVLPDWVNMLLPFVGMGVDVLTGGASAGATAVMDILNSLDMFFGAKDLLGYALAGLGLLMAVPALGDALGVTAGPIFWLAEKVNKAKGAMGVVIKKVLGWGPIKAIGGKVADLVGKAVGQFKEGGKIYKFVGKMWDKIPKDKAGPMADKMKGAGGAKGVMGKMADKLSEMLVKVKKMFGFAVTKVKGLSQKAGDLWKNSKLAQKWGVKGSATVADDLAAVTAKKADDLTAALKGKGIKTTEVFEYGGKTLTPGAGGGGMAIRSIGPDGMVKIKATYPGGGMYGKALDVPLKDLPPGLAALAKPMASNIDDLAKAATLSDELVAAGAKLEQGAAQRMTQTLDDAGAAGAGAVARTADDIAKMADDLSAQVKGLHSPQTGFIKLKSGPDAGKVITKGGTNQNPGGFAIRGIAKDGKVIVKRANPSGGMIGKNYNIPYDELTPALKRLVTPFKGQIDDIAASSAALGQAGQTAARTAAAVDDVAAAAAPGLAQRGTAAARDAAARGQAAARDAGRRVAGATRSVAGRIPGGRTGAGLAAVGAAGTVHAAMSENRLRVADMYLDGLFEIADLLNDEFKS
jgi:hypothetical protein